MVRNSKRQRTNSSSNATDNGSASKSLKASLNQQDEGFSAAGFSTPSTPKQNPPSTYLVPDLSSTLAPPKPLSLQGSTLQPSPSFLFPTPTHQPTAQHSHQAPTDKPRSMLVVLNDFLENAYKLQDRAHKLWLEEQHEMKRGIALNIIYSPTSDASHHSQHFVSQQENDAPSCCVTPGAQVIHELGHDRLLFSPPSAKMDALFGCNLASTPTAAQLTDHTAAQLLSPTALGLHSLIQDGSARSLPESAHAPFLSHRLLMHSQFHPLHNKAVPSSCHDPPQDAHLSSPHLPYHAQPQSTTTQRYWQPLSGGSSAGTAPTLRCPPAINSNGLAALGSRSPLSRQQHASTASLTTKPSRALLFHHTSNGSHSHTQPQQQNGGSGVGELSPCSGFRASFGAAEARSLRQQLLQQQLESSAVESPTAVLQPRAGKPHDLISCPDSPADYLLSQPSSSKHAFQQPQQQQQHQQLDFLGGNLRLCTTPLAKRQKQ